jgi:hypothetical protein
MKDKRMLAVPMIAAVLAVVGGRAISAQDKYTVEVPGGLAFSEFRGYEAWQAISLSHQRIDRGPAWEASPVPVHA